MLPIPSCLLRRNPPRSWFPPTNLSACSDFLPSAPESTGLVSPLKLGLHLGFSWLARRGCGGAYSADLGVACSRRRLFLPNDYDFPGWSKKKLIFISGAFLFYIWGVGSCRWLQLLLWGKSFFLSFHIVYNFFGTVFLASSSLDVKAE